MIGAFFRTFLVVLGLVLSGLFLPGLGALGVASARAESITGEWLNERANLRVHVGQCGAALCGKIAWLQYPNDQETGELKKDRNNPDPEKRSRPLVGIEMLIGMKPSHSSDQWLGQIYLPGWGKTYDASFTLDGADGLKIEGCALGGILCRTERWTRPPEARTAAGRM